MILCKTLAPHTNCLAHAVSFLASDGADFLTGLSIPVTDGSLMR